MLMRTFWNHCPCFNEYVARMIEKNFHTRSRAAIHDLVWIEIPGSRGSLSRSTPQRTQDTVPVNTRRSTTVVSMLAQCRRRWATMALNQCCFNVGPSSTTLAQHWNNIDLPHCAYLQRIRGTWLETTGNIPHLQQRPAGLSVDFFTATICRRKKNACRRPCCL